MLDTVCLLYIIRCDTYYVINLNTYILFSTECLETGHIADGYCDDVANTEICNWDGGDCCGPNRVIDYCTECQCHETTTPTTATPTTAAPTTTAAAITTPTPTTAASTTTAAAITTAAPTITTAPTATPTTTASPTTTVPTTSGGVGTYLL